MSLAHEQLADAYASARLCLNIHSLQCPTCLNSRDFDVLTAKGCLVSDEVEDLHAGLLEPGLDCATFQSAEELQETVRDLLSNAEKREAMREQGHQTCREKHTPAHRAGIILDLVKTHYLPGAVLP